MKSAALAASLVLAAACGGARPPNGDDVAVKPHVPSTPAPTADPTLAARLAYSNQGGMWMPQQMALPAHVEQLKKLGVTVPGGELADPLAAPLGAVISLGGCTASFVSPEGLVITNHHCVQSALVQNSTPENNLVETGFLAATRADEKSAGPAAKVYVAQAFTDVTAAVRDGLDAVADPIARKREVEARTKAQVKACEDGRPGLHCKVASYYNGGQYLLIEYLEIRDVRLVYVPHRGIGNYGGEVDNWQWPRHTGDYSFYRAYVGKDGKPADFSPDNVPYRPKHYLTVSAAGVRDRDFAMIAGYPGGTERTHTAAEVMHDVEWYYPYAIASLKQKYAVADELIAQGGDVAIKATNGKQGFQNYMAKFQGVLDGLHKGDLLARKHALDARVKEWAAQPGREAIRDQIAKHEALLAEDHRTARVDYDRGAALKGSKLLATALGFMRWAEERPKADAERKPGYQDRDMPRAIAGQKSMDKGYNRIYDRAMFRLALVRALELPEADRPWLATIVGVKKGKKIDAAAIDKALDALYATTKLEDQATRLALLQNGTTAQLAKSKDPFVRLAVALWPTVKADEKREDTLAGELVLVAQAYPLAMREVLGGQLPPDANGTLRVTYGTVKSFKPESTTETDWPFTTTAQLAKKATGVDPFDPPRPLLDAIAAKKYGPYAVAELGGEVPVCFLTDLDITNGNSGSATLDNQGRLVGLAFDGTIAGVASDVVFDGETTRTIHADVRYVLWVMDAVDKADHLLREMGVTPAIDP